MNAKNGTIYIVLTALAFGTMEIALKIAGSSFTAFQLTFLRFFIGGLLLLPLAVKDLIRRHVHLTTSDWGYIAALGIINVMFSMVLFQIGVNKSNAGLAAIVFSCNPVFTMIFSSYDIKFYFENNLSARYFQQNRTFLYMKRNLSARTPLLNKIFTSCTISSAYGYITYPAIRYPRLMI